MPKRRNIFLLKRFTVILRIYLALNPYQIVESVCKSICLIYVNVFQQNLNTREAPKNVSLYNAGHLRRAYNYFIPALNRTKVGHPALPHFST